ncbi:hypothetical protein F442_13978 [Phytophthora nicotianae P10297]|uniref:Uncharacterized protein n=1 Tax=Phytophthora nicotianae P10297 TaxID=1317064 RepID=W2YUM3_PHYNI|nr:hypothetical protein F442_13978 [Phytophthora nicotianae P10297]
MNEILASKPSPPARNPPRASYSNLGGRTVRLEAPDELGKALCTRRSDAIPASLTFLRPCVSTSTCFTGSPTGVWRDNLANELLEHPLLSVFRYARFTQYFATIPRNDQKFVRRTSEVHLCGQVVAYVRRLLFHSWTTSASYKRLALAASVWW